MVFNEFARMTKKNGFRLPRFLMDPSIALIFESKFWPPLFIEFLLTKLCQQWWLHFWPIVKFRTGLWSNYGRDQSGRPPRSRPKIEIGIFFRPRRIEIFGIGEPEPPRRVGMKWKKFRDRSSRDETSREKSRTRGKVEIISILLHIFEKSG